MSCGGATKVSLPLIGHPAALCNFFKEHIIMRKLILTFTLSAAALALGAGSVAYAVQGKNGPDADGNGVVTKAEATTHAAARFAKMDVNQDGVINAADREAKRAEKFAEMDTDGSGEISQSEMTAAHEARMEKRGERGERAGKRGGHGMKGGKRGGMDRMMQADTNGDQAISRAEFDAAAQARFTKADTDNDGGITETERKAARDGHRAERKERRGAKRDTAPAAN
jgi:Ca2+-binding EF-hand superfamily protein